MTKPVAASAAINSGHSLAASLVACWPMLEGAGLVSADKTGYGHDMALDAAVTSWTTESGDLVIAKTDGNTRGASMAANLLLTPATKSFSIAWRGNQTTDSANGIIMGFQPLFTPVVRMNGSANACRFVTSSGTTSFTKTLFTTTEDHLLTFDFETGNLRYYVNGVENASSPIVVSVPSTLEFDSVLGGYQTGTPGHLVGLMHYLYVWEDRVLSGSEAASLSADPYLFLTDTRTAYSVEYCRNATGIVKHTFSWVSNSDGSITIESGVALSGQIERVDIVPDATTAPTANYDLTLTDEHAIDVLAGQGANMSASASLTIIPGTPLKDGTTTRTVPTVVDGFVTLNVTNAGGFKAGTVAVYVR